MLGSAPDMTGRRGRAQLNGKLRVRGRAQGHACAVSASGLSLASMRGSDGPGFSLLQDPGWLHIQPAMHNDKDRAPLRLQQQSLDSLVKLRCPHGSFEPWLAGWEKGSNLSPKRSSIGSEHSPKASSGCVRTCSGLDAERGWGWPSAYRQEVAMIIKLIRRKAIRRSPSCRLSQGRPHACLLPLAMLSSAQRRAPGARYYGKS